MNNKKRVAIIGSGIGGMATAIRLAHKGYEVDVYEKNNTPGGKLSHFEIDGFQFDAGPSLFTQPENVTELFELCGEDINNYFKYSPVDVACKYFFESGKTINAYVNTQKFAEELHLKVGEDPQKIINYLDSARRSYTSIGTVFLENSLHKIKTFFQKAIIKALMNTKLSYVFQSMNEYNEKSFDKAETIQIFNRFATYNGSNPYIAPAMLTMIPHLEQNEGTFYPHGGMINITNAIYQLAIKMGARFHFEQMVDRINTSDGKISSLQIGAKSVPCDIVVSNMDVYYTYKKLLDLPVKAEKLTRQERSSSAVIFYWGIAKTFEQLGLHNILFSEDYREEFYHIFDKKTAYNDPTIYINITSKMEAKQAPSNMENWFVMVNVSHDTGQDWDQTVHEIRNHVKKKLNRMLNTDLDSYIIAEQILHPKKIESMTASYTGSLYGTSSNGLFAAFLRHPNFSSAIKNLYFVGGSVHPGGGIPLCLKSAKIVSEII